MSTVELQLEDFRAYVLEQTRSGSSLTLDELYENWKLEHPTDEEHRMNVLAVKAALRDIRNGDRGQDFDEFMKEFKTRHNIADVE